MNTKRISLHIGLTLMFLGTVCVTGSAWTRTVGKDKTSCPNAKYDTITAAVNAAAPGDIIKICPGLYPEQLIITKSLTLRGVSVDVNGNDVDRVLLQPSLQDHQSLPIEAVITVMNTSGVTIENLAVDASKNGITGCTPKVADIHFFNASGKVIANALFGAQLTDPKSCAAVAPGNGFGILVNSSTSGPFHVSVEHNSIHDYTKDGIQATGAGIDIEIEGNTISGVGPSIPFQFAVFVINGAIARIHGNIITEGPCGTLTPTDCFNARSEGITLRAVGDGTIIDRNLISKAQSGIFVNAANHAKITNNFITNIDVLDGIDLQGTSNSLLDGNTIFNATPIDNQDCGIFETPGPGQAGGIEADNTISHTSVNDAYCGVAFVPSSDVDDGTYFNVLYKKLRSDLPLPPPTEP